MACRARALNGVFLLMSPRFKLIPGGDAPDYVAAQRMGMTLEAFKAALPNLIARGFPKPDPTTGNFDLDVSMHGARRATLTSTLAALSSVRSTHQRSCKTVSLR
jgi:hypothetical protein